jgi:Kinesin motor domain
VRLCPSQRGTFDRAWAVVNGGTALQQLPGVHKAAPHKTYGYYDHVLDESATNTVVYQQIVQPVVGAVLLTLTQQQQGKNKHGTVFAYGPTSSGKTHTMQGTRTEPGMIELAAVDIFRWIADDNNNTDGYNNNCTTSTTVKVQYFEIYNEQFCDLLVVPSKKSYNAVSMREDKEGNVIVNASEMAVDSVQAVLELLQQGNRYRARAATLLNADRSRSHAIYRLSLQRCPTTSSKMVSVLNLVDLAGSENRTAAGRVVGNQKREAGQINPSLFSLWRVVHAQSRWSETTTRRGPPQQHISDRDSKLTRIVLQQQHWQDADASCMAVLCCVSASRQHVEETKSTLQFAASAKRIVAVQPMAKQVNLVDSRIQVLSQLQEELAETKEALHKLQAAATSVAQIKDDEQSASSAEAVFGESLSEPNELWSDSVRSFVSATFQTEDPPVPEVILWIHPPVDDLCIRHRLEETQQRAKNFEERLSASDSLANTLFKNLKDVRGRYEELERLNKDAGSCDDLELMLQHSLLQRVAFLASVVLLYHGQFQFFAAMVAFLFASLEVATS